ncbi:hypothetical protein EV651_13515 [Kribbella sp. VKM Ac-2571]|uniref:hypothetical protein n=1 Tax=Kribbella sp. VKM Ac-2571 TaxID=2512222 RepID=UPI001061B220|nr:hypothetical protein [Kribbella sp. VKM Ac-2571]TDO44452.1 hypothetical protein EV651_13515 [Kribbella sp. VKM Ac-2571]
MDVDLEDLIAEAARSGWAAEPSRLLAEEIESHIVVPLSSRLRAALGRDEAEQLARAIAWERCLELATAPPPDKLSWGYLATHVRWRLMDAARAHVLHGKRHRLTHRLPEPPPTHRWSLGPHLETIAVELERAGLPAAAGRRLIRVAADGPPYYRAAIIQRLRRARATAAQAEGMAWLLRGGTGRPSALARLALGQAPGEVFSDPVVRRWIQAASGRDQRFFGGPSRLGLRRAAGVEWLTAAKDAA